MLKYTKTTRESEIELSKGIRDQILGISELLMEMQHIWYQRLEHTKYIHVMALRSLIFCYDLTEFLGRRNGLKAMITTVHAFSKAGMEASGLILELKYVHNCHQFLDF